MLPSKKRVDSAGDVLRQRPDHEDSLDILSTWRGYHVYPLGLAFNLLKRYTDKVGNKAIYGQRLKRVSSIVHKLERMPQTKLSRMQDIGGCRVILSDYEKLRRLYLNISKSASILSNHKDYITYPKQDGYRGIHLIYQCSSKTTDYHGAKIELQLRTKLQHAWATAVEIVDSFEGEQLKSGGGSNNWRRFFYLIADEFARLEKLPLHDNSIENRLSELQELSNRLNVIKKLEGYTIASDIATNTSDVRNKYVKNAKFFILGLDINKSSLQIWHFINQQDAQDLYIKLEKQNISNPEVNVLMVKMSSVKQIKTSYPNYFADSRLFIDKLKTVLLNN